MVNELGEDAMKDSGIHLDSGENTLFTINGAPKERSNLRQNLYEAPLEIGESFNGNAETMIGGTIDNMEIPSEVFPVFNHPIDEKISYQIEEGTTEDQAEFITHKSNSQDYDPERDRLEQMKKSAKTGPYFEGDSDDRNKPSDSINTSDSELDKQQNNQNERNRARAEEISSNNFKFVPKFNYEYHEVEDYQSEIESWFLYEDNAIFEKLKLQYLSTHVKEWRNTSDAEKVFTLKGLLGELDSNDNSSRRSALASITYIALGGFGHITSTSDHVTQIKKNTIFLWKHGSLVPLYQLLVRNINEKVPEQLFRFEVSEITSSSSSNILESLDLELMNTLTILYFMLETNRNNLEFAQDLDELDPPLLQFLIQSIGRLRWGISGNLPLRNLFLFFWKAMLCLFGDSKQLAKTKSFLRRKYNLSEEVDDNAVTASPLDYHAFRQDIISRYPAYIPPSSCLPDFIENSRSMSHYIEIPRPVHAQSSNNALPVPVVHIATPAPSPPASPAIAAGQKVRKSVFMTNQSFPFIHPTTDTIPQSIIEASELFATRVHTTTEMVQLWEERYKFMTSERGWVNSGLESTSQGDKTHEEVILDRIERLYVNTISQLNSFILVILKFMLVSISLTSTEGHIDTYFSCHQGSSISFRAKEISLQAVSSVLEVLSNWYRVSHVVKFEYLSTLLFDSRYYLLVFKYFYLHNPLENALLIPEDPAQGFFHYTAQLSSKWNQSSASPTLHNEPPMSPNEAQFCEEVKVFSKRYFFTTINLVRVLQHIIKGKTQRIIIVAELPPMTLRKALNIYQQDIWEIVLDIFKEEVPFNGRKWKCNNMNLVSAIYLHCKTKLRDDWLVGGDVNQEIDDAHPQEIAIRALIQFYNDRLRRAKIRKPSEEEVDERGVGGNTNGDKSKDKSQSLTNSDETDFDFFKLELEALSLESPLPS